MTASAPSLISSTRAIPAETARVIAGLQPGQRIRVTHVVRVGRRHWTTTVTGIYRELKYLATGLATDRMPEDDIIVPTLHFTKENGELSSVALDEHSKVEQL